MHRLEFLQLIGAAIASLFVGFRPEEKPVLLEAPSTENVPFHGYDGWREDFAMDVWTSPNGTEWTHETLEFADAHGFRVPGLTEFHVKRILENRP